MKLLKRVGVIILFAMALLVYYCVNKKVENTNEDTSKSVIKAPLPNLDINSTAYTIDTQKDTVLTHKTGSKINIPKNAFLDSEGNIVKGKVDVSYREFSNAFEIYLGGIPMQYDSAGTNMVFETAGMLEIKATSNNKPVYVNPDSKITIDMNSFEQGNRYNLYQLDTLTGKWTNIGKDRIEQKNYNDELSQLPTVPPQPKKATGFTFTIGDETGKYPELAMYENVLFEPIDGQSCGYSGISEIKVKKLNHGKYEITFILIYNGTVLSEEKCICYLVFKEGANYSNAMKVYQNKYASLIKKRKKMEKKLEKEWADYFKIKNIYIDAGMEDFFYKKEIKNTKGKDKILRTLTLSNFGFINCDVPSSYPQGARLLAKFEDKKGNEMNLVDVVLVVKGRNALFRYTDTIKFNPTKQNVLWGITEDGSLAYFNSDDFKTINSTSGDYVFKMNVHNQELKTYEDITNVLFK